jgi:nitrite reductase/ring-hydroxylating ferredoxin subunit
MVSAVNTSDSPPPVAERVCAFGDLAPLEKRLVYNGRRSVLLCRGVDGAYYAVGNSCPHQGASLCEGTLGGTALADGIGRYEYGLDGLVVRCPWHGWEFDVRTGYAVAADSSTRVASYEVTVVGADVYVARGATRRR